MKRKRKPKFYPRPYILAVAILYVLNGIATVATIQEGNHATRVVAQYQRLKTLDDNLIVQAANAQALYHIQAYATGAGLVPTHESIFAGNVPTVSPLPSSPSGDPARQ